MAWRRKRGKTGRPGRPPPLSIPAEGPAALASPLSPNFTLEQDAEFPEWTVVEPYRDPPPKAAEPPMPGPAPALPSFLQPLATRWPWLATAASHALRSWPFAQAAATPLGPPPHPLAQSFPEGARLSHLDVPPELIPGSDAPLPTVPGPMLAGDVARLRLAAAARAARGERGASDSSSDESSDASSGATEAGELGTAKRQGRRGARGARGGEEADAGDAGDGAKELLTSTRAPAPDDVEWESQMAKELGVSARRIPGPRWHADLARRAQALAACPEARTATEDDRAGRRMFPMLALVGAQEEPWLTGLFECWRDPWVACKGALCPCLLVRDVRKMLTRNAEAGNAACFKCMLSVLVGCVLPPFAILPCFSVCHPVATLLVLQGTSRSRAALRRKYNLEIGRFSDTTVHLFFMLCALCQEVRELKRRKATPGNFGLLLSEADAAAVQADADTLHGTRSGPVPRDLAIDAEEDGWVALRVLPHWVTKWGNPLTYYSMTKEGVQVLAERLAGGKEGPVALTQAPRQMTLTAEDARGVAGGSGGGDGAHVAQETGAVVLRIDAVGEGDREGRLVSSEGGGTAREVAGAVGAEKSREGTGQGAPKLDKAPVMKAGAGGAGDVAAAQGDAGAGAGTGGSAGAEAGGDGAAGADAGGAAPLAPSKSAEQGVLISGLMTAVEKLRHLPSSPLVRLADIRKFQLGQLYGSLQSRSKEHDEEGEGQRRASMAGGRGSVDEPCPHCNGAVAESTREMGTGIYRLVPGEACKHPLGNTATGLVLPSAHIRQLEALVEEACGGDGEERERKARFLRFVEGRRRQLAQQACIDQARRAVLAEQAAVERLKKREASAASVAAACMPSQAACLPTQSAVARRRKRQLGSKKSTVGGTRMKAVVVSGDGEGSKSQRRPSLRRRVPRTDVSDSDESDGNGSTVGVAMDRGQSALTRPGVARQRFFNLNADIIDCVDFDVAVEPETFFEHIRDPPPVPFERLERTPSHAQQWRMAFLQELEGARDGADGFPRDEDVMPLPMRNMRDFQQEARARRRAARAGDKTVKALTWQEYRDRVETGGAPPAGLAVARGGVWERRSSAGHVDIALRVLGSRDARDVPATVMIEPGGQVHAMLQAEEVSALDRVYLTFGPRDAEGRERSGGAAGALEGDGVVKRRGVRAAVGRRLRQLRLARGDDWHGGQADDEDMIEYLNWRNADMITSEPRAEERQRTALGPKDGPGRRVMLMRAGTVAIRSRAAEGNADRSSRQLR